MKARPILMSSPMVRALLDGRKTQTRRILKGTTEFPGPYNPAYVEKHQRSDGWETICPYGQPGDLLWVREKFIVGYDYVDGAPPRIQDETTRRVWYAASDGSLCWDHQGERDHDNPPWKPSIHMPRSASRLTLELTEVRVERLQIISEADVIAEGVEPILARDGHCYGWMDYQHKGDGTGYCTDRRESYASLWESIHGVGAWDANPWLWVLCFRFHRQNVDDVLKALAA